MKTIIRNYNDIKYACVCRYVLLITNMKTAEVDWKKTASSAVIPAVEDMKVLRQ